MNNRWWIYQKERFPVFAHGLLVLVFCLSIILFSALQQGDTPDPLHVTGAVVSALLFFFQLRVADEFKDASIDARYRPDRPVPRGLVSLSELKRLAQIGAAIQFLVAVSVDVGLVPLLAAVWAYIGLMTREFLAPEWLRRRPVVYLVSHMLVMPLIAFYVSAFDWLCDCRTMPAGIGWLLSLSFGLGLVLEIGRKIRIPAEERTGVETYSALWGWRRAVLAWTACAAFAIFAYGRAADSVTSAGTGVAVAASLIPALLVALLLVPGTDRRPLPTRLIEPCSALVTLLLYAGLGPLQLLA